MLASGRPVIAGAMPNTAVQEVEDGVVVPPSDSVAMADAICRLIANPQERRELGARAAERAIEHWGKDRILLGFELQLKQLLAGNAVLDLSRAKPDLIWWSAVQRIWLPSEAWWFIPFHPSSPNIWRNVGDIRIHT